MKMTSSYQPSLTTGLHKAPGFLRRPAASGAIALILALSATVASPFALAAQDGVEQAVSKQASGAFWQDVSPAVTANIAASRTPAIVNGKSAAGAIQPRRFRGATLDRNGLARMAATAPHERSANARRNALVISLPHPDGGYQRFAIVDSPIMEEGLAAKHPEIKTYSGRGIDDPRATVRMDITPLGLHASVRAPSGAWYIDPAAHLDDSVYASYHSRDLPNPHGVLAEGIIEEAQIVLTKGFYHAGDAVEVRGVGFVPGASVTITVRNPETDFGPV